MSLATITLQFPKETVTFKAGSFEVGGLSLSDLMVLVSVHRDRLNELFSEFVTKGENGLSLSEEAGLPFAMALLQMSPAIAAHIIAQAEVRDEGEEPQFDTAARLPVDVQIDALDKIIRLTFQTEGGPKKVLETLVKAFAGTFKFAAGLKT